MITNINAKLLLEVIEVIKSDFDGSDGLTQEEPYAIMALEMVENYIKNL